MCNAFRSYTLLGSQDDNDFEDVARFMIDEYGIKECLEMPAMTAETSYSNFKKLFQNLKYIDVEQIAYYKKNIKNIP